MTDDATTDHAGTSDGMADGRHRMSLRVYYEDTDFSGFVYHANYLRFFERGRTELLRALGIDQRALHAADGIAFVVRSMTVEFVRPAVMDDIVVVETATRAVRGPVIRLAQVLSRDGSTLSSAEVTVVCIRKGKPCRLPEQVRRALAFRDGVAALQHLPAPENNER
jgi:acyl-CoA thioester hydrolase